MKNYVKIVQAVQYLGDINVLKGLVAKKDVLQEEGNVYLAKFPGSSDKGYWKLKDTDYVAVENGENFVYKKERFEKDFDEVIVEDQPKDKIATDNINVVKSVEVKVPKKGFPKKDDVDKKE
jgi:hypothetical protein